jgi:hypothetical protein
MFSVGAQPRPRIFSVSRWIKGESPAQPRSPPAFSICGVRPIWAVIVAIESSTVTVSSVPKL